MRFPIALARGRVEPDGASPMEIHLHMCEEMLRTKCVKASAACEVQRNNVSVARNDLRSVMPPITK